MTTETKLTDPMVPYERALDLIGDAYNAGTHGIGYSQQAMELHDAIITAPPAAQTVDLDQLQQWVVQRWHEAVANRPLHNGHRRSLDDTWREVLRKLGVDDVVTLGPRHDDLLIDQQADHSPDAGKMVEAANLEPLRRMVEDWCDRATQHLDDADPDDEDEMRLHQIMAGAVGGCASELRRFIDQQAGKGGA